jgi:hypothetical protein
MPALNSVYTGAHGFLVISGGGGNPEGADAQAVADLEAYGELLPVGRHTGIELYLDTDLEEFHEVGRRYATSLHPGNVHIHGKVERAYVNGALLVLLQGRGALTAEVNEPFVQPAFDMNVLLDDPAVPNQRLVLDVIDVKFENWALCVPEDDFVMENLRFKALKLNVRDEQGGNIQQPEFPESA